MSLVTTLKRRVTKPCERTRVTGKTRAASARLLWECLRPSSLSCKVGTTGRYGGGTNQARVGAALGGEAWGCPRGPSVCLAGARLPPCLLGGPPSPSRAPACLWGVGLRGSGFTFPAFTLSHHLGVCVLGPPSHEPAGKTGEPWVRGSSAWLCLRAETWVLSCPQKPAALLQPLPRGPGPGRNLPTAPPSAGERGGWVPRVASTEAWQAAPGPGVLCTPSFPTTVTRGFEGDVGLGAQYEPQWKSQKGDSSWGRAVRPPPSFRRSALASLGCVEGPDLGSPLSSQ